MAETTNWKRRVWMAIGNVPLIILSFFIPLPEGYAQYEAVNFYGNLVFLLLVLGYASYAYQKSRGGQP